MRDVPEFPCEGSRHVHVLVAHQKLPWLRSMNCDRTIPVEDVLTTLPSTEVERESLYEHNYNLRSTIDGVMYAAIRDLRLCPSSTSASALEALNASSAWAQNMNLKKHLESAGAKTLVYGKSALGFNVASQMISVRSLNHARFAVEWIGDETFMHPLKLPVSLHALPMMFVAAISALLQEALKPLKLDHVQPRVGIHLRNPNGQLATETHGQYDHRRHLIYYPSDNSRESVPHIHMRYPWI